MARRRGLGISAHDAGIGAILHQRALMVPPNQRSYAWEGSHVQTLFEDLSGAIDNSEQPYFLGTLVLSQSDSGRLEVADGQQRLATTSILIAGIRDYLDRMGQAEQRAAQQYTSDYLLTYDPSSADYIPKLQLNYVDNDYFLNQILKRATDGARHAEEPDASSHKRLFHAAQLARQHIENVVSPFRASDKAKALYRWISFLHEAAMVIAIIVPDDINAYTMFETLNDRGLRASQTDILKNSLFGKAQDRLEEIQMKWSSMVSAIETVGDENLLLTYIRHHWTLSHGYTSERQLAELVKDEVVGRQQALSLVGSLDEGTTDYVGLLGPLEHSGWPTLDRETRAYLYVITRVLSVEQTLPLLVALLRKFDPAQVKAAAKIVLSWSVRFTVAGSGGGGPLDRAYGQMARDIVSGNVRNAAEMRRDIRVAILRTDAEFKRSFSQARVTKAELARYYLRALELQTEKQGHPELGGVTDDTFTYNLEHVMPQRESPSWDITEQTAQQFRKRLGNMVLLAPSQNTRIGNRSFQDKRGIYAASPLLLTQEVGRFQKWEPEDIDDRQRSLAEIAVAVWPD